MPRSASVPLGLLDTGRSVADGSVTRCQGADGFLAVFLGERALFGRRLACRAGILLVLVLDKDTMNNETREQMLMTPQLIQFSTVVAGNTHNPSILNPDFLAAQDIVPEGWGWKLAETFTTPPMALVRYEQGVSITIEPNRLQVIDAGLDDDPTVSKAADIASAYASALPHVHYTSVGINFQSIFEASSPEELLKTRFVREGAWDTAQRPLHAAGLRLVYELSDGARVTLSLDAGEAVKPGETQKRPVVIARANFNRNCEGELAHTQVEQHLRNVSGDWATYQELISATITTEA